MVSAQLRFSPGHFFSTATQQAAAQAEWPRVSPPFSWSLAAGPSSSWSLTCGAAERHILLLPRACPGRISSPPTDSIPKSAGYSLPNASIERYKTSSPTPQLPLRISARFSNPSRRFLQGWDPAETRSSPVLSVLSQAVPNPLVSSPFSPLSSCARGSSFGGRNREWEVVSELHGGGNGAPPRRSRGGGRPARCCFLGSDLNPRIGHQRPRNKDTPSMFISLKSPCITLLLNPRSLAVFLVYASQF